MELNSLMDSIWDASLHDLCQLKSEVFDYLQKSELGTLRFIVGNQKVVTPLGDLLKMFPRNIIKIGSFQQLFKLSLYYSSHYLINKIREKRPRVYMGRSIPNRVIDVTIYYFILPERFRTSQWKQNIYNHLSDKLKTPVQIVDDKIDLKNLKQVVKDNEITEIIKIDGYGRSNRKEDRQPDNVYNFNMLSSSKLNDILEVFYDLMPKPYNLSENEIEMVNRDAHIIFIASPYPGLRITNDPYEDTTQMNYVTRAFFKNIPPDLISVYIKKTKAVIMSMLLNRQYVNPNIIASVLDINLDDAKRIILLSERESFPGSAEDIDAFMSSVNLQEPNDAITNKVKVFLFRLPQLLELTQKIHQDPTSLDITAEFGKPMDPTGKWFPGTIYDAMESPMDAGFVNEIKIEIASRGSKYNDLIAYDRYYNYRELGIEVILDNHGNKWVKNPSPQFNFTGDVRTIASSINQGEVTTYGSLVRLFYLLTNQPASIDDMLEAVFSHRGEEDERIKQYHTQAGYRLMSEVEKYSDIMKIYFDSYPNAKEKEIAKKLNMDDLVKNAKQGTWIVRYIVKSDKEDIEMTWIWNLDIGEMVPIPLLPGS